MHTWASTPAGQALSSFLPRSGTGLLFTHPREEGWLAGQPGPPLDRRWASTLATSVDVKDSGVWMERLEGPRKISAHTQTLSPGASLAPSGL